MDRLLVRIINIAIVLIFMLLPKVAIGCLKQRKDLQLITTKK